MNCQMIAEIDEITPELAAHAETCAVCAGRLRDLKTLSGALAALRTGAAHVAAPPALEARLLSEYRAAHAVRQPARRRIRLAYWGVGAAAASLLIALAWTGPQAPPAIRLPSPLPPAVAVVEEPTARVEHPGPRRSRRAHRPASGQTTDSKREVATDFLAVPYAPALTEYDRAEVVRVKLPRSSLHTFGLPFDENRAAERIQADVLLGEDGIARAVRFVR